MAETYTSVWDAISDTPQDAASMKLRSTIMIAITRAIRAQNMTQAAAAKLFGVTQPRISDLMRGKIGQFSLESLLEMAAAAGVKVNVTVEMPAELEPA